MPYDGAVAVDGGVLEHVDKAAAVDHLVGLVVLHAGHLQDSGEEVLNHHAARIDRTAFRHARPVDHHRLVHAAHEGRAFSGALRIVLVAVVAALTHVGEALSAIVGHEEHDGVLRHVLAGFLQEVEQVAQALVHARHERGPVDFALVKHGFQLLVVHALIEAGETVVLVVGHMDGVVRHIEVERLALGDGFLHRLDGFEGKRLGEERVRAPVLLQPDDGLRRTLAVVLRGQEATRRTVASAGNVDVVAHGQRVLAGRGARPVMGLAAMDGVVSVLAQNLGERRHQRGVLRIVCRAHRVGLDAVEAP